MRRAQTIIGAVLAGAWLALGAPGLASAPAFAQAPARQALPVGTVAAALQPITPGADFVGRVEAIDRVEVRARVTGFLLETFFKEGDTVQGGRQALPDRPRAVPGRACSRRRARCCRRRARSTTLRPSAAAPKNS